MLVRYLEERKTAVDYTTLKGLARDLASTFWSDLEKHQPGIATLQPDGDTVTAWKGRLKRDRRRRRFGAQDAVEGRDPAVPGEAAAAARTGEQARDQLRHATELLSAAKATSFGESFQLDGVPIPRCSAGSRAAACQAPTACRSPRPRGPQRGSVEDEAFWTLAMVETLRHSGVRIEELLELTHLGPCFRPAVEHRRTRSAAPDRAVEDQRRTAPARLTRALQCPGHDHQPAPN